MAGHNFTPSDFYVYLHRRATDGRVFYVGKGRGRRAVEKWRRTKYWKSVVNKHGYTVEIVQDGMQEWWAFELECELIAYYGRDNLCNMTDGGDGRSGSVQSQETRKKISQKHIGRPKSEQTKAKMKEAQNRPEQKILRQGKKSVPVSNQTKRKLSDAAKRQHANPEKSKIRIDRMREAIAKKVICVELNIEFDAIVDAEKFLTKNFGIASGANKNIAQVLSGNRKTAYGFSWKRSKE